MTPSDSPYDFIPPPQSQYPELSLPGIVQESLENSGDSTHLVLVVIDGLGWWNLQEYLGHAPNLRRLMRLAPHESAANPASPASPVKSTTPATNGNPAILSAATPPAALLSANTARSVFPATTAAAITSLLTGLAPGAHNMLSYQVFDPQLARRFNLITFEDYPGQVEDFQNQATWFERLACRNATSFALGPKRFIGGGLTRAALRGATYIPVEALEERARQAAQVATEGVLTYLYMAEVDHAGHGHGVGSEPWLTALEVVDRAVGVLLQELHVGTEVIVTADHGMLNTAPELTYDLAASPLAKHITQVAGEGRVLHLRVASGEVSRVHGVLAETLAPYSADTKVLTREGTRELFAAYNRVAVARPELLGDLVIVSGGRTQVLDSRFFPSQTFQMVGVHGSLTEVEMRVPRLRYCLNASC